MHTEYHHPASSPLPQPSRSVAITDLSVPSLSNGSDASEAETLPTTQPKTRKKKERPLRSLRNYSHHWRNVISGGVKAFRAYILLVHAFPDSILLSDEGSECLTQSLAEYRSKVKVRFDDKFPGNVFLHQSTPELNRPFIAGYVFDPDMLWLVRISINMIPDTNCDCGTRYAKRRHNVEAKSRREPAPMLVLMKPFSKSGCWHKFLYLVVRLVKRRPAISKNGQMLIPFVLASRISYLMIWSFFIVLQPGTRG
jgi:hypothetical protein